MRLFIAIELSNNIKKEIGRARSALLSNVEHARAVPLENMHITLRFLGETDDLNGAVKAMRESVRGIRPFALHLSEYGCFGSGAVTSYIGILGELKELNALYESLQSSLWDEGFSREYKRFVPHITLARNVARNDSTDEAMRTLKLNASMQAQGITLFESVRSRDGAMVYTPLHKEKF